MNNTVPDPDRRWRRAWRIFHSPVVLLPAFVTSVAAAATDVAEAVPRFGWLLGAVLATQLLAGMVISLVDLVPHLTKWLLDGHARASTALARAGHLLQALSDWIATITADR